MTRPAIFFDRDNTLIIGNDYLGDPAKVVLVSGAADAVAKARQMGFATVVVSNQSGVARGMFGEDDVRAVNARMDEMLRAENGEAIIERHEFCPFHPQAPVEKYRIDSDRRKPRPGMLLAVAKEMNLDLAQSWIIGDAARDVEAGKSAGCRAILFSDKTLPNSPAAQVAPRVPPDFVASSLKEAMDHIAESVSATSEPAANASADALFSPEPDAPADAKADAPADAPADPQPEPLPYAPAEATIATSLARIPRAAGNDRAPESRSAFPPELSSDSPPQGSSKPAGRVSPDSAGSLPSSTAKLELLADQILQELRRSHEVHHVDFSVSKLLAGIVQVIAVAVMFLAYLNRDSTGLESIMLLGIFLQTMACSLLIMSGQK